MTSPPLPDVSFKAPQARVLRVWRRDVEPTPSRSDLALSRVLRAWSEVKRVKHENAGPPPRNLDSDTSGGAK